MPQKYYITYSAVDAEILGWHTSKSGAIADAKYSWEVRLCGKCPKLETMECPKEFFDNLKSGLDLPPIPQWLNVNGTPMFIKDILDKAGGPGAKVNILFNTYLN